MVIGDISKTYQWFINVFLLTIAVNGFIKGLNHKYFNVICWVNSQAKVEQVSFNFSCELLPKRKYDIATIAKTF